MRCSAMSNSFMDTLTHTTIALILCCQDLHVVFYWTSTLERRNRSSCCRLYACPATVGWWHLLIALCCCLFSAAAPFWRYPDTHAEVHRHILPSHGAVTTTTGVRYKANVYLPSLNVWIFLPVLVPSSTPLFDCDRGIVVFNSRMIRCF